MPIIKLSIINKNQDLKTSQNKEVPIQWTITDYLEEVNKKRKKKVYHFSLHH